MKTLMLMMAVLACLSCAGGNTPRSGLSEEITPAPVRADDPGEMGRNALPWPGKSLDDFAEIERSGVFIQGMGITESVLREEAGDYDGAVFAAYKELSWMYSHGMITKEAVETGLKTVIAHKGDEGEGRTAQAAGGILAFTGGQWEEAENMLAPLFSDDDEPDSFVRWLLLICALEKNPESRAAGSAYGAIRARYSSFPEYWYRGARAFSGAIAADYAERCISLAPAGPFAEECRSILAAYLGLGPQDGSSLKSLAEIKELLAQLLSSGNPRLISGLLPLISLPDNPYTVYAVGALRAMAASPRFGDYFETLAKTSSGRLAERLRYICGGRG
jgi:hypothetical protein